jgi:hypothetical protein
MARLTEFHRQQYLFHTMITEYKTKYITPETTRYTILVQTPWAKRQVEILRSGS